ncbi:VOC family protein [Paenibacillus cremeus]|uniref:Glyoxalase n=1 Tax=Paenibacillus cremeus TaxID=2163881 RepID=A0A559KBC5_9BACL|nr:VOC family protein [Paenibacillus cremeus]TVY09430.1 glyoxalase [Paenibacillus cremeus]
MIPVESIHHISLNVKDLERSKAFYSTIIGLKEIERPPFDFPGAWFGIGEGGQQLHLIVYDGETLREGGIDSRDGHFALRVRSYKESIAWLDQHGIQYDARPKARAGFPQIYVIDPDRNVVELNAEVCDLE